MTGVGGPLRGTRTLRSCAGGNVFTGRDTHLRAGAAWPGVEVENLGRDCDCAASVRNIDNAADTTLDGRCAQNHVCLFASVAEFLQILDSVEAGTAIGNMCIEVVLLACFLIDGDPLEHQVFREAWLDRARLEDRIDDPVFSHAALDEIDADIDVARHLDGAAEGDLAVALRPMDV